MKIINKYKHKKMAFEMRKQVLLLILYPCGLMLCWSFVMFRRIKELFIHDKLLWMIYID